MTRRSEKSYICGRKTGHSKFTKRLDPCFFPRCLSRLRTYFSPEFQPKVLRIWQAARGVLIISSLLLLVACSSLNQTEFYAPFELSSFLKNHIQQLPGQMVQFQILDTDDEPIPHDLLHFEWSEGGRISFQTDQDGTLSMQFEKDMLENEVMVSAKSDWGKIKVVW